MAASAAPRRGRGWRQVAWLVPLGLVVAATLPARGATSPRPSAPRADRTATLDVLVLGDQTSETAHSLTSTSTRTLTGALDQPARQALPLSSTSSDGGSFSFTMAVSPTRRNYVSIKLWGGDDTTDKLGRLYLYAPVGGRDQQVGYQHEGDYLPLSVAGSHPPLPGRFFYSTTMLPLPMTRGRTSVTLEIVAKGRYYSLGSGGPTAPNPVQYAMDRPSRPVYRAYTHVDPLLDVSGEVQGKAPAGTVRPAPTEAVLGPDGAFRTAVARRVQALVQASPAALTPEDVAYLAHANSLQGVPGSGDPALVRQVVAAVDAAAAAYATDPTKARGWGGATGPIGCSLHEVREQLTPAVLDATATFGSAGTRARRAAWADLLHASREWGRLNDRRTLTNQTMLANESIYCANRGLQALGDKRAFDEPAAQRYLEEAAGLRPWLDNDLAGGGSARRYGDSYRQVTAKGMTREWGFAGAGYGEQAYRVARWYRLTGNPVFRDQAVRMAKARAPFRRPALEVVGDATYRTFEVASLLAWRGAHESDGNFAGYVAYAEVANTGDAGIGMSTAATTKDPVLIGYAKQMLADNQFFGYLAAHVNDLEALDVFADYRTVRAAPDSGARLPMTDGRPDFVWADEESGVAALKRGDTRLWVAPYWQAKAGTGINGVARFHYSVPDHDQFGVLETTPRTSTTTTVVRPDRIDLPEKTVYAPPSPPSNAYAGERLPVAPMPAGATSDDPFRGKAEFYSFRIGRYLFGMNTTATSTFTLRTPGGVTGGRDLVSGQRFKRTVTVRPLSTVVLDTGTERDLAPVPNAPLAVWSAPAAAGEVTVNWSPASGADSYTVLRSTSPDRGFAPVATGLTATTTRVAASAGAGPYLRVVAVNASGRSEESMVTVAR